MEKSIRHVGWSILPYVSEDVFNSSVKQSNKTQPTLLELLDQKD
jgi:hypothetical protein